MNSLSNTTVSKLADALKKEVIDKIYESPEYTELMQDLIPNAIHSLMGQMDEDLAFEIGMLLFDRIELK
jgi:ADP-dependent phosphofructokinase/glucokinase